MIGRVTAIWHSLSHADGKRQWILRKIKNRIAKPKIRTAWKEFVVRLPREQTINEDFDRRHGTDTAEELHLTEAGLSMEDALRGRMTYRPVWESEFHAAVAAVRVDVDGFTFVDVGSGKGKMLLMAADYPFERIVGVEYSPKLHAIAERNIAIYSSPTQRCKDLESVYGDALDFELPKGSLFCFIFNALDAPTMSAFMHAVEGELASRHEAVFVIYSNLRHVAEIGDGLDGVRKLLRLESATKWVIFGNPAAAKLFREKRPSGTIPRTRVAEPS